MLVERAGCFDPIWQSGQELFEFEDGSELIIDPYLRVWRIAKGEEIR